ncbi:MAG: ATP-binding protein [Eubacteriales bacterium]|nr:ATP-binding protein [Eubacteriales bacterium]
MVAFQYIGLPPVPSIHFEEANIDDIQKVTEFVEKELKTMGCPRKSIIQIKVAIDEIFSNILHYGYPNKKGPVTVDVIEREDPHSVYIRFSDHGIPYNPIKAEDPDVTLSAEEREIGGLGIYLVKQSMDDMKYKYENGQNILTIQKII